MKRRVFFRWIGLGWLTSTLFPLLAACDPKRMAVKPRADGFVAVGSLSELDQAGGKLSVQAGNTPLILVGSAAQPQTIGALNLTCTHAGCTVKWETIQKQFVCPCHGAKFDAQGQVAQGPAAKGLTSYTVKVEDQSILVKLT